MTSLTDININAFAEAVRAELADLSKREIQELTEGLEADLGEKFVEEGADFTAVSAAAYAAELREAAGISAKPAKRSFFSSQNFIENIQTSMRKTKFSAAVLEFGISVRPVWWVLRAFVAWLVFAGVFYSFTSGAILLPIFIFLSIQWGRKKWFTSKFFTSLLLPLNLLAVALLLPTQGMLINKLNNYANAEQMLSTMPGIDGLRYNGELVTELKAYDAQNVEVGDLKYRDQSGQLIELPATDVAYFKMPEILGMTLQDAQVAIDRAGAIGGADIIYESEASEVGGVVVAVNPPAGAMLTKFDIVQITIGNR